MWFMQLMQPNQPIIPLHFRFQTFLFINSYLYIYIFRKSWENSNKNSILFEKSLKLYWKTKYTVKTYIFIHNWNKTANQSVTKIKIKICDGKKNFWDFIRRAWNTSRSIKKNLNHEFVIFTHCVPLNMIRWE